jgi:hypothetical protein
MGEIYELLYLIDLDGTILDSKSDWSKQSLRIENLRNLSILPRATRFEGVRKKMWNIQGCIVTGRHESRKNDIIEVFLEAGYNFREVICRSWDREGMDNDQFMIRYWNWKINEIMSWKKSYKVIVWDNDVVVINMCKTLKIHCTQFYNCKKIG